MRRTCSCVRIDPQISPIALPPLRMAARQCVEPAAHCARTLCKKPESPKVCDRYEPGPARPLLYADYLEKQNQRKPDRIETGSSSAVTETHGETCPKAQAPAPAPADTGLGPKLGDIPAPNPAMAQHQRVVTAYQVQRFAPTGSLVDVLI